MVTTSVTRNTLVDFPRLSQNSIVSLVCVSSLSEHDIHHNAFPLHSHPAVSPEEGSLLEVH